MKRIVLVAGLLMVGALIAFLLRPGIPPAAGNRVPSIATRKDTSAGIPLPSQSSNSVNAAANSAPATSREMDVRLNPYAAGLQAPGKSKRSWDTSFLTSFQDAKNGDPIHFELTEGRQAAGSIRITQFTAGELTYLSGELTEPEAGKFFFLKPPAGGKAGQAVGVIEFAGSQTAYRIEPTGANGDPELWQRRLDEVLCVGMPPAQAATAATNIVMEAPPLRPDVEGNNAPSYNTNLNGVAVISLQSYPGAKGVLLLDFFGGYTPTWGGVPYSVPSAANNVTIKDVWKRVAEDYLPFNINVTTDIKIYQAAPASSRQRCAFTDTPVTAAGVAYFGSWNWGNDTPCWSVYTAGKNGAEVGAHEAGHTLGLSHETQEVPNGGVTNHVEYYGGHNGPPGWAPTMGVGYYQPVSGWSKGEFIYASNNQDELNTITTANNNVTYRTDDTGNTLATSRYLEIYPDNSVFAEGVIERTADTDAFQFTTTGGQVALMASPAADWSNLGIMATVADSTETVIASNNPQTTLSASISTVLPAGTYTFRVTGAGRNDPTTNGFSSYASLGYYSISGFITGARLPTRFDVMEHSTNGTVVGTIVATDTNSPLAYAIVSGNSNSTFSVDSNGVLRVANSVALDYTALATNTSLAVQYELFVDIVNLTNPLLTESNRRVVVGVQSVSNSYPIVVTGYNAGVIVPYNATVATPKATGFDIGNNYCFYQVGLFGNAQVGGSGGLQGLPASGIFTSRHDGSTFRFGPYGGTNALMMGNIYPISGKLTLTQPRAYNSLTFIASSANGGGLGTCFITFTNGAKSQVFSFNDQDWFNTTANVALTGLGRIRLGQATLQTEDNGFSNPNLYQTTLNLAAIGSNLMVASITFTNASGQDSGIFALSGLPMPDAVAITVQPVSITNNVPGQSGTLTVVAMGAPSLACQWYQGNPGSGTPLANQTNFNLTFTPVQTNNAGNYFAIVTNGTSSATSAVASVVVYREPQILAQIAPTNSIKFVGQKITFTISANAATPVNYFWRFNGTNISGAVATSYTLNNLQLTNTGNFTCLISNTFGMITSSVASLTVVATNYPYAQRVINDRPIGYWRLDEPSGTIAHDYVANNNGVFTNALLNQTGYNLIDIHKAARFGSVASVNSYVGGIPIDFGTTNYTANTNGEFSVEAWVNGGAQTSDAGIITKGAGGGNEQFNLDCGGGGHAFRFFVRDRDGGAHLATGNVTPNNQWHHLVGVCDQTNGFVVLYVDGVSNASGTISTTGGILDSTDQVTFGSRKSGAGTSFDNQFLGLMEEVAIYNYPLSAAQAQAHFAAATNRAPVFVSNPFSKPSVNAGQSYSATIATNATDPNGDAITFAKVSGPAWLTVAAGGSLSGTPANGDANTNTFIVSARDAGGLSNTASLFIYVNGAPSFLSNPFSSPTITAGQNYSASIAAQATDPNPFDPLSFGKVSGPAWLIVSNNGALTGTPFSADVGTNSFAVTVSDPNGLTGSATMTVIVTPAPAITSGIAFQGANVALNWSGGIGPFQVQMSTNLTTTNWQTIATNLSSPTLLLTPTNDAAFYRILGK